MRDSLDEDYVQRLYTYLSSASMIHDDVGGEYAIASLEPLKMHSPNSIPNVISIVSEKLICQISGSLGTLSLLPRVVIDQLQNYMEQCADQMDCEIGRRSDIAFQLGVGVFSQVFSVANPLSGLARIHQSARLGNISARASVK